MNNGVRAERNIPGSFSDRQPDLRLKPLAIGVDQAHDCNGSATDTGGQFGQLVIRAFGGAVENAARA